MTAEDVKVPVFRPTMQETLGSWEAYNTRIEPKYAHVGICKVVPPKGWKPSKTSVEEKDILISGPILQELTGTGGLYQAVMQKKKAQQLRDFRKYALDPSRQPHKAGSADEIEREFWQSTITRAPPLYGADTEATLFDDDMNGLCVQGWNLSRLDSLLTRGLKDKIPGVNTAYLYFGSWRSFFGWHTEDMELSSVNYLHYGAPKQWYCIPPGARDKFERYVRDRLSDCFRSCPSFFRHKELLLSPALLKRNSIPFVKVLQHPGEMIINSPGAYHAGFNTGFNCAEATNFATESWLRRGATADVCQCRADSVSINMREFIPYADKDVQQLIEDNWDSEMGTDSEEDSDDEEDSSHPEQPRKSVSGSASTPDSMFQTQQSLTRRARPGKAKASTAEAKCKAEKDKACCSKNCASTERPKGVGKVTGTFSRKRKVVPKQIEPATEGQGTKKKGRADRTLSARS